MESVIFFVWTLLFLLSVAFEHLINKRIKEAIYLSEGQMARFDRVFSLLKIYGFACAAVGVSGAMAGYYGALYMFQ